MADGSSAGYAEMEEFLAPSTLPRAEWRQRMMERCIVPTMPPCRLTWISYSTNPDFACPAGSYSASTAATPTTQCREILHDKGELDLALGRQFLPFRRPVVERIIHMVSRENALFAVATALPNVVPSLIELPWAFGEFASDTAFLTANQVRMAFQIAAACGKDVGLCQQKGAVLTIAAGAFGWRALARELVGHIPLGGGLIPKGAIAYAGTYVVGKGMEYLHCMTGTQRRAARTALPGGPGARPQLHQNYSSGRESGVNLSRASRVVQCSQKSKGMIMRLIYAGIALACATLGFRRHYHAEERPRDQWHLPRRHRPHRTHRRWRQRADRRCLRHYPHRV